MKIEDQPIEPEELEGLELTITCLDDQASDKEAKKGLEESLETGEPHISKNIRPEHLRKLMTPRRREITRFVKEKEPDSISETAEKLDRGLREVDQDLKLLERLGILQFKQEGRGKKPVIPYSKINIDYDYLTNPKRQKASIEA